MEDKKTYFISGATGFIGSRLALRLAEDGHTVHALLRSESKAKNILHPNIRLFPGDLLEPETLRPALEGCHGAFHLAALAKPWSRDPDLPRRVNVDATARLLEAAQETGVRKVVFTSSAATLEICRDGDVVDEETPRKTAYFNQYDLTKSLAEKTVREAARKDFETVIVNPSRVYGPGLLSVSNGVARIMKSYLQGRWRIIPGDGTTIGNYVFVEDVVQGHILAMDRGRSGERYILGGENISFNEMFATIRRVSGKRRLLVRLPAPLMHAAAWTLFHGARLINAPPLITPSWMKKYLCDTRLSSRKAIRELGYTITPFEEGTEKTISWIKKTMLT